jgi:cytochrome c oxidase subunit 2
MVASGADLFQSLACYTCHRPGASGTAARAAARAPQLEGLYGNQVRLADGRTLVADDNYLRESILNPTAKVVAGWQPIMPTYQGQVTEEQLAQLVAYVRSLGGEQGAPVEAGGGSNTAGDRAGGQVDSNQPQTAGPAKTEGQ